MLDSWGRPEAGLLTGVTNWIGDYGECTSAKSISQDLQSQFQGKYCTGMHPTSVPVNGQVSLYVFFCGFWIAVLHTSLQLKLQSGKGSLIFAHCVVLNWSFPMPTACSNAAQSLIWFRLIIKVITWDSFFRWHDVKIVHEWQSSFHLEMGVPDNQQPSSCHVWNAILEILTDVRWSHESQKLKYLDVINITIA